MSWVKNQEVAGPVKNVAKNKILDESILRVSSSDSQRSPENRGRKCFLYRRVGIKNKTKQDILRTRSGNPSGVFLGQVTLPSDPLLWKFFLNCSIEINTFILCVVFYLWWLSPTFWRRWESLLVDLLIICFFLFEYEFCTGHPMPPALKYITTAKWIHKKENENFTVTVLPYHHCFVLYTNEW